MWTPDVERALVALAKQTQFDFDKVAAALRSAITRGVVGAGDAPSPHVLAAEVTPIAWCVRNACRALHAAPRALCVPR
jgi:hypothetical protein